MEFQIDLNKVEDVKEFVRRAGIYDTDIIVSNQKRTYMVDGTSIMGLFSLDLSQPLIVHVSDKESGKALKEDVRKFVM